MLEPPIDYLYLDTSIIVAGTIAGSYHSGPTGDFFANLIDTSARVYFSQLARYEFAHAICKLATSPKLLPLDVRYSFALDQWDTNFMVRRRWIDFGDKQFVAFFQQFEEAFELPLHRSIWPRACNIMSHYGVNSYDAVHIATAQREGIRHFASCDKHFDAVDGLIHHYIIDGPA